MKSPEKLVVTATSACHALVHMLELTYGVVLIGISLEFNASLLAMGVLANIFGLALGVMSLPSGLLADHINEKKLLIICCGGMALSAITIGLSPNIFVLGIALLVLGLALGVFHPVAATFIARTASQRGLGFGYFGIGGNLGLALGPLLAGIMASLINWRASYFILAVPAIILGVLFLIASSERPASLPPITTAWENTDQKPSLKPVLPVLILIFAASVLNGLIYRGLVTFLPLHLSQRIGFSFFNLDTVMIAGSFTTIALIFGVGGQFLGGYFSERLRREKLVVLVSLMGAPLLFMVGTSTGVMLLVAAITFGFFYFMSQPVHNGLLADYVPVGWHGRMYGIYFFCTFGIGSFSASILGFVADKLGTGWVFIISSGFGLFVLTCAILILRQTSRLTHRKATDQTPLN